MKFLRRNWKRHPKLGKGKKKKQVWRKPKGRDNKMREMRKGYPKTVKIGYGKPKNKAKLIIRNISDLEKVGKNQRIFLGKIGKKKKLEIAKLAKERQIVFANFNPNKFMKKTKPKTKLETKGTKK